MDRSKWEYKKLGEVCAPKTDILRANKLFGKDDVIEYIDISSIDNSAHYITQPTSYLFHEAPSRAQQKVEQGDILYSLVRPNLKNIAVVTSSNTEKYVASSGFCVLRSKDIDNRYLYHLVLSNPFTDYILGLVSGANYPAVREDDVKGFSFRCPSITDQQRIVAELDCLNEMIAVKQEQLKEFDKLAQSIFYDMFGDPMVNDKRWEVSSYGKIFEIGSGGTPSKSITDYWEDGDIPWIGSNMCQNCFIYDNDGKFITQKGLKNSSAKVLKTGTILFALVGATIGKVGILKKEMATNQNIAFVNVWKSEDFDSIFVFFNSMKLYPLFMNLGNGGFKMANQSFIKDLPIICPPLSLQQQFAEKISAIEAQKELVKQSIAETQALLDYTMDYYFND